MLASRPLQAVVVNKAGSQRAAATTTSGHPTQLGQRRLEFLNLLLIDFRIVHEVVPPFREANATGVGLSGDTA
jgi:hypothetical protein